MYFRFIVLFILRTNSKIFEQKQNFPITHLRFDEHNRRVYTEKKSRSKTQEFPGKSEENSDAVFASGQSPIGEKRNPKPRTKTHDIIYIKVTSGREKWRKLRLRKIVDGDNQPEKQIKAGKVGWMFVRACAYMQMALFAQKIGFFL